MNKQVRKISPGQIIILFGAAGALYASICGRYAPGGEMLGNAVLSALVTALLSIPLCIFSMRQKGDRNDDIMESIFRKSRLLGIISGILLTVYFIGCGGAVLISFGEFVSERVFPEGNIYVCLLLTGLVCIYAAHTGAQAVSRMTTLIFGLMLIAMAMFLFSGYEDIFTAHGDMLIPRDISLGDIFKGGFGVGMLPVFTAGAVSLAMLTRPAADGVSKGLFGGLAAMLLMSAAVTAAVWAVLGDFTVMTEYPALDAAVYAGRHMTFSFHGLFYALWIITAAAAVSMLCACGGRAMRGIFPGIKVGGMLTAGVCVLLAMGDIWLGTGICRGIFGSAAGMVLLVIVPLIGGGKKG